MAKMKIKVIPSKVKIIKEIKKEEVNLETESESNSFDFVPGTSSRISTGLNASGNIVRAVGIEQALPKPAEGNNSIGEDDASVKYETRTVPGRDRNNKYDPSLNASTAMERRPLQSSILENSDRSSFISERSSGIQQLQKKEEEDFGEDKLAQKYREGTSMDSRRRARF